MSAAPTTRPSRPTGATLGELGEVVRTQVATCRIVGDHTTALSGVSLSSQRVQPGDLYAALPGSRVHGIRYLHDALSAGCAAVLTDPDGAAHLPGDLPALIVEAPRAVLGRVASRVYGDAAARLTMIGVTGTQGKTTTTRLAESALEGIGAPAATVGTVGTRIRSREVKTSLTTPEAPDLHGLFAVMVEHGVAACAMEVSSHALVMGRVDGVVFDVAVFTNLGRDHLDFHRTEEDYFAAKAALFTPERARSGVVNLDDEHGRRLLDNPAIPLRSFSLSAPEADWRAVDVSLSAAGSRFTVLTPDGRRVDGGVPLAGDFNVANALAAIAACAEAGFDVAAVASAIAAGPGVPGRLERIDSPQPFEAVVDYAHKPDAVRAALETLRPLTDGSLIVVLGAGGERDPGKRPLMGRIAAELADLVVVTDDNPRSEDAAAIRRAVVDGTTGGVAEVVECAGRRLGIRTAVRRAAAGDIVMIAGKGHETGQEIEGVIHPFDDRVVVSEELNAITSEESHR